MFGKRLKELRSEKNLTQEGLAKIFDLSDRTIGMYEQERREPDIETLNRLAGFFNVTVDYLLGRTDSRNFFTAEYTVDGHKVEVTADKNSFPGGFTEEHAIEYLEVFKAMKTLDLTRDDLELISKARQFGIKAENLDLIHKLLELGIRFDGDKK